MREVESKVLEKLHEIKKIVDENGGSEYFSACYFNAKNEQDCDSVYYSFNNAYFDERGKGNPIQHSCYEVIEKKETEETTEVENELQKD